VIGPSTRKGPLGRMRMLTLSAINQSALDWRFAGW
jgi:hypothetical protein